MRAAARKNSDLTDFVLQPAQREAEAVIEAAERTILSERDSLLVLSMLENPPVPTPNCAPRSRRRPGRSGDDALCLA